MTGPDLTATEDDLLLATALEDRVRMVPGVCVVHPAGGALSRVVGALGTALGTEIRPKVLVERGPGGLTVRLAVSTVSSAPAAAVAHAVHDAVGEMLEPDRRPGLTVEVTVVHVVQRADEDPAGAGAAAHPAATD